MKRYFIGFYASVLAMLFILTFFDLSVSAWLYSGESFFVRLLSETVYLPSFFIGFFGVVHFLNRSVEIRHKTTRLTFQAILFGLFIILSYMFTHSMRFLPYHLALSPVLIALLNILAIKVYKRCSVCDTRTMDVLALTGITSIGFLYVFITFLKRFIGRARPYIVYEDESLFTHWFEIQEGFASVRDFYSFPSGHIAFAAISFWFILLVFKFARFERYRLTVFIAITLFVFVQGLIRVYLGEHFITDTIGSTLIGMTGMLLFFKAYDVFYGIVLKRFFKV